MKPINMYEGTVEGDLQSLQSIEMDLDLSPEGRAHLLSLMTDLYSDQEMAVIREYSTNALDSHIEAGVSAPIEVSTPTDLSPYLTITDQGVGLSINDLERIYSKYGASTKRGSDAVNGMLGLGGKSALTYAPQFMVTAVKAGVKSQIVVTRNEDGIGVMEVVDTRSTNEGNGVTIKIPAKHGNDLRRKAREFFYFWQPGTVILDGREPAMMVAEDEHTRIGDRVVVQSKRTYGHGTDIIVMGNVPYPTKGKPFTEVVAENSYYNQTVVFVDMGEVSFAPSREAISYTPRTEAAIARIKKQIAADLSASIAKDTQNAKSYADAFRAWLAWGSVVGVRNLPTMKYKGFDFVRHIQKRHCTLSFGTGRYRNNYTSRGDSAGTDSAVDLSVMLDDNIAVVVNYPNDTSPAGNSRARLHKYVEDNSLGYTYFLFFDTMPGAPWTDGVETIDWDDVKAVKLPKAVSAAGGRTGTIPVLLWESGAGWIETKDIDQSKPVVYMSPTDLADPRWGQNRNLTEIQNISKVTDVQFVSLGANRWNKFVRENPTAVEFHRWNKNFRETLIKSLLTKDQIWFLDHDGQYRENATKLSKSDDPDFARLAGIKVDDTLANLYNERVPATKELYSKYPLLRSLGYGFRNADKHSILYINAVHNEKGN